MRKTLLFLILAVVCTGAAHADDYPYLTITGTDGSKTSLTAVGLTLTFGDGQLTATNAYTGEEKTIALTSLATMNFSKSNETTGIRLVEGGENGAASGEAAVYTLQGRKVEAGSALPKGIYIIKKGQETKKVEVR